MMDKIKKNSNIYYIVFLTLVVVYFYFMMQNFLTGDLSVMAFLCVIIFTLSYFYLVGKNFHIIKTAKFPARLVLWSVWCILFCLLCGNSLGQISSSFLWVCAYLITYLSFVSNNEKKASIIMGLIVCAYSVYLGLTILDVSHYVSVAIQRDDSVDVSENIAMFSLITLPFIFSCERKIVKWFFLFLVLIVTILTARRISFVCIITAFILAFIQESRGGVKSPKKKIFSFLLLAGVAYLIYILINSDFSEALTRVFDRFSEMEEDMGSGRTTIYAAVWNSFSQGNILEIIFGHGFLGVDRILHHTAAHNDFLEYLYDFGIIGLLFYLSLHSYLIKRIKWLFKRRSEYFYGYLISYVVFLTYSMFGNIIIYPQYFLTIPIFWGMVDRITEKQFKYLKRLETNELYV